MGDLAGSGDYVYAVHTTRPDEVGAVEIVLVTSKRHGPTP